MDKKYRFVFKVKPEDVYSACDAMNSGSPEYHSHVVQIIPIPGRKSRWLRRKISEDYYIILIELNSPYPYLINKWSAEFEFKMGGIQKGRQCR
jgi:hypothetical protein